MDDRDTRRSPAPASAGLGQLRSGVLIVLSVEAALLVTTGIALWFMYRPSAAVAWNDAALPRGVEVSLLLAEIHRIAFWAVLVTAVLSGVLLTAAAPGRRQRRTGTVLTAALFLTTAAAGINGFSLAWDQLGLWAVTVGDDIRGFGVFFGDDVRFVLVNGFEYTTDTFVRGLLVHVALLGPAVVLLIAMVWRRHRQYAVPAAATEAA